MKKTLSLLLVFAMLLSVCSSLLVFADDRVNVAAGKTYVISEQFRQSNITWGYDESFPPAYPDDGGELTDGKVPADNEGYLAAGWVGFNHKTPAQTERGYAYITIDLEDMYALSGISVAYGKDTSVGITVPYWVEYFVSEDGETFEKVGYSEINPDEAKSGTNWYSFDFDEAAQYVQLRVFSYGWAFVGEIEVYGMAYGAGSGPEVTASAEVVDGSVAIPSDEDLAKLVDGEYAEDATAFSNAGLVAFQNTGFEHGKEDAVPATVAITVDLDYARTITKVSLTAYKELNSMIALPEVSFEVSVDGVNFYQVNAGTIVKPAADAAENTVVTLTADFSTRAAVEARYVRAIASFTNGWIFLSELDVTETDAYTAVAPNAAFPYADAVSATAMGVYDANDGTLDLAAKFKNSQLIKAVYDEEAGAYKVIYSKVNPWPDGQSGYETMGDHEILVAINTGGNLVAEADETKIVSNLFSACKWIARGLTEGDYLVFDAEAGTASFYPAEGEFEAGDCITSVKSNVALNKPVLDAQPRKSYKGYLTDGYIQTEEFAYNNDWFGFYWNGGSSLTSNLNNGTNAFNGLAIPTVDLGAVYDLTSVRTYVFLGDTAGITAPESVKLLLSVDGVNYKEIDIENIEAPEAGNKDMAWIEFALEEATAARYVRIEMKLRTTFAFMGEIEAYGTLAEEQPVATPVIGEGNLALYKSWYGDDRATSDYLGYVTDGQISEDKSYNKGLWYGFDYRLLDDSVATMILDLGAVYSNIDNVRLYVWPAGASGIAVPKSYTIYGSADGVTYTELGVIADIEASDPCWYGVTFDKVVTARYIKIDIAGDTNTFWFVGEIQVNAKENTKVEVNVNENEILTDGKTGFTGAWGAVGTGDVALVTNTGCKEVGMDATLLYALGETKKIESVTVDFYYDKNVMIGYPEGKAVVMVSTDGETYTEVGKFDLVAADYSVTGTISNKFVFDEVEAAYVKVLLYAGSNAAVLGNNPADGKIFWEFISVAEFAVGVAVPPIVGEGNLAAGKDFDNADERSSYYADLTDGVAKDAISYTSSEWFGFYWNPGMTLEGNLAQNTNAINGLAIPTLDLGAKYELGFVRVNTFLGNTSGICAPEYIKVLVSNDGETFTEVAVESFNWPAEGAKDVAWVELELAEGTVGRYVRIEMKMRTTFVFINEIEIYSVKPEEAPVIGDLDGDEEITEADVEVLMSYLVGSVEAPEDVVLDLDGNGAFDIYDCVLALQYIESLAE